MNFINKAAFLTGASSGIGRATAKIFAAAGFPVAVSARSESALQSLCEEIRVSGGVAESFPADVRSEEQLRAAMRGADERFGGIGVALHIAGMNIKSTLNDLPAEDWDTILDTNLKSVWRVARLAHPYLTQAAAEAKCRAKFLSIGSYGTFFGIPLSAAYCASKGGLVQLLRALAVEWARDGICVNAVCPGYVLTPLSQRVLAMGDTRRKVLERIPMRELGKPEDVGNALLFLASREADYITGATLNVDGGLMSAAYTMDE